MRSVYKPCRMCIAGRAICVVCGGSGIREHQGGNKCPACQGSGRVICGSCGGAGGRMEMEYSAF